MDPTQESEVKAGVVKFVLRFVQVWVAAILAFWMGLTPLNVSGLVGAVQHDWDAAGGAALIAAIIAAGGSGLLGLVANKNANKTLVEKNW